MSKPIDYPILALSESTLEDDMDKGANQQAEILIDYIEEIWETIDLLRKVFGEQRIEEEIIHLPSLLFYLLT